MNYVNLTNGQYNIVLTIFKKYVQIIISRIKRRANIDVAPEFIIQFVFFMFRSRYDRKSNNMFAIKLLNDILTNYNKQLLMSMLLGENTLGFLLRH